MKKILALAMAVLMLVGCCATLASCGGDKDTIKIGLSGPTTGAAATYGIAVENSAKLAIKEINENGGLKNGLKLELLSKDDAHDSTKVAANYAWMQENGMQVALGCVTSNPCLEFVKLSNKDSLFFLTPSASANAVVTESNNGYQMCFADDNQGKVAAAYVNGLAAAGTLGKLGIFYKTGDPYSEGIYNQFIAALDKTKTGEPVVKTFTSDDEEFTPFVADFAACDFIFMPIYYTPAAKFMEAANGKVPATATYYGCDGFDGIDTSVEGFDITKIPQKVTMLSHFNSKANEGKAADYIKAYVAEYGEKAPLNQFGAAAYDCVYALVAAMNAAIDAGKEINADTAASELCAILKAQFASADFKFSGATGTDITWDADGFVSKAAVAYVIK